MSELWRILTSEFESIHLPIGCIEFRNSVETLELIDGPGILGSLFDIPLKFDPSVLLKSVPVEIEACKSDRKCRNDR